MEPTCVKDTICTNCIHRKVCRHANKVVEIISETDKLFNKMYNEYTELIDGVNEVIYLNPSKIECYHRERK